eukprot:CAMPEP_0185488878 /NCGR_PEP_ID=MMETSP1366-20130426/12735_1 /TAXON_ID=38817 /ORGANISM="Gephyrocapsa oceanica, Strain RCC1303" /LENGTH=59 /DNA_ID=CAMNT_0028097395 /DNA_START=37 /DNA_END=214 /DNA_ORIENTATION=-
MTQSTSCRSEACPPDPTVARAARAAARPPQLLLSPASASAAPSALAPLAQPFAAPLLLS